MNRTQLAELIRNGENSGVDFKRDDVPPEKLAKVAAAFLNLEGGYILLGVEDDGTVSGLTRETRKAEEWLMQVLRDNVQPGVIPFWETIDWGDGKIVGVVTLPADAPDKPYKIKRGSGAWVTQVRVGTTTRDASREEELRLYMQSGHLQYDRKPVPGATFDDLDLRRLANYFRDVRRQGCPEAADREGWERLLVNTELMAEDRGRPMPSVAGVLLFGTRPKKFLPQSGITAVAYSGTQKDYDARARQTLSGPLVSLFSAPGSPAGIYPNLPVTFSAGVDAVEAGVIEQTLEFIRRNIEVAAHVDEGGQRQERWEYPLEAMREAIVNAVAHRDYTIGVTDIELSIYADRIEVVSPGRLPNTVTVDKMRAGYRASRNELVKEVLRDYRYIEATGLGVPRKIIEGMRAHNGTEPDLVEEEDRFIVRLWKEPRRS
jgi:ATP-dependent DNA helicase RecG